METPKKKKLNLIEASMIVAGSMIGSGIFIVSAGMTRSLGSSGWLIATWIFTGVVTTIAALSYGELAALFPKAGGQYVYLKEAYGRLTGFLYGWSFFMIIQTGTIAAVAVAFAKFAALFFPFFSEDNIIFELSAWKVTSAQLLAIGSIILLSSISVRGIKDSKFIQTIFTLTKLLSLCGLIAFGLVAFDTQIWNANWSTAWQMKGLIQDGPAIEYSMSMALGAIAVAMVGSIFSSDAWNNVTFIAGEVKNARRNIGLSLFYGTFTVTIIYVLINVVYLGVLSVDEIAFAGKDRVAVAAANKVFGYAGTGILAVMIMISTFGCNNGLIFSGARVYAAMAEDGLFFRKAAKLNKSGVPAFGTWMQCLVASLLCLSGKYGDLLDMISLVVVMFYVLTILGIFILRRKQPNLLRPYKAFGYPFLPAFYLFFGVGFCALLITFKPEFCWPGLLIVGSGMPVYFVMKKQIVKE